MSRYFFVCEGATSVIDDLGLELSEDDDAWAEAIRLAAQVLGDCAGRAAMAPHWRVTVSDHTGRTVFVLSFMAMAGTRSNVLDLEAIRGRADAAIAVRSERCKAEAEAMRELARIASYGPARDEYSRVAEAWENLGEVADSLLRPRARFT